jgi:hypothetical protein
VAHARGRKAEYHVFGTLGETRPRVILCPRHCEPLEFLRVNSVKQSLFSKGDIFTGERDCHVAFGLPAIALAQARSAGSSQ